MFNRDEKEVADGRERLFTWARIKTILIGSVASAALGLLVLSLYIYFQYGSDPIELFFGAAEKKSPAAGKLAFTRNTKEYIGVIKGEGYSQRLGQVYYIEQAGGAMIQLPKELVEARDLGDK